MAKLRVALLFGGVSGEHEISCISAAAVADHLSDEKYEIYKIGITKKGRWLLCPGNTDTLRDGSWAECADNVPAVISPDRTTRGLVVHHGASLDTIKLDCVFPVLHGYGGEDGTVQGLLELSGIPYVGCGVLASALCMDKSYTNLLFDSIGIPHTPWVAVKRSELEDMESLLFRLGSTVRFPVCVKPAGGGSSLGVSKVESPDGLRNAAILASAHDATIVIEQLVEGQEVECAVLGNTEPIATKPGEIKSCNELYDYEAKYHSNDTSELYLPAHIPPQTMEQIREYSLRAFKALGCSGLARVDFFVEKDTGRVLINEINTLPGFTPISMYPKLMEMQGISFSALADRLILFALERAER